MEKSLGRCQDIPYPKLEARRKMMEHGKYDPACHPRKVPQYSKRKRDTDSVIEQFSHLDREAKNLRALSREEPHTGDDRDDSNSDSTLFMRRQVLSLDDALKAHWICVCHNCSGLSVRLSLSQPRNSSVETTFEVFFGVLTPLANNLQEAKITIR
jgi:CBS-domain-containing membrane protein